jgi:biopolymer transport protein ExbD
MFNAFLCVTTPMLTSRFLQIQLAESSSSSSSNQSAKSLIKTKISLINPMGKSSITPPGQK